MQFHQRRMDMGFVTERWWTVWMSQTCSNLDRQNRDQLQDFVLYPSKCSAPQRHFISRVWLSTIPVIWYHLVDCGVSNLSHIPLTLSALTINIYQHLSTSINIYKPIHNYPSDLERQRFLPKKPIRRLPRPRTTLTLALFPESDSLESAGAI